MLELKLFLALSLATAPTGVWAAGATSSIGQSIQPVGHSDSGTHPRIEIDRRWQQLADARALAESTPNKGADKLRDALRSINSPRIFEYSGVVSQSHQLRLEAWLSLTRAYLLLDRRREAEAAMDQFIQHALGESGQLMDKVSRWGPPTLSLYQSRLGQMDAVGKTELSILCGVQCEVYINEIPVDPITQLYPGLYRLEVRSSPADLALPLRREITIHPGQTQLSLEYSPLSVDLSGPPTRKTPSSSRPETKKEAPNPGLSSADTAVSARKQTPPLRTTPRWVLYSQIAAAAGGTIGGITLLAIDGRCPGQPTPCVEQHQTKASGTALLTIGLGFAATTALTWLIESKNRRSKNASQAQESRKNSRSGLRVNHGPAWVD